MLGIVGAVMLAAVQLTPALPELAGDDVRAVEVTDDDILWVGVSERGLARIEGGRLEWDVAFPLDGVADLFVDAQDRLWAAGLGGAAVLEEGGWTHLPDPGGLGAQVIFRISEEPGEPGALWFATTAGAARLADGDWEIITTADGLPHSVVHAVHATTDGVLWFACRRGLARLDDDGVTIFEPENNFRTILPGAGGDTWFGTSSGLRSWRGGRLVRTTDDGVVYPLLAAEDGTLWSGSVGLGVLTYSANQWRPVPGPPDLVGAEIFDLAADGAGTIWVASSNGVWTTRARGAF